MRDARRNRALVVVAVLGCAMLCATVPARAEVVRVGTAPFASLSGYVYADMNDTCALEVGEYIIPNVKITLTGVTEKGDSVSASTVTGTYGDYAFLKLEAGTYTLTETQPIEFLEGKYNMRQPGTINGVTAGTNVGTVDGPNAFKGIKLVLGSEGVMYNFGEAGLRSAYVSKRQFLTYTEKPTGFVPEPTVAMLLATGLLLLLGAARRPS
jgi:hypothetical protein